MTACQFSESLLAHARWIAGQTLAVDGGQLLGA